MNGEETIGQLFTRTLEGEPLGFGNAATVYPLAGHPHYVLRVPHDMRAGFTAYLQGTTPFTPLDRFYETGIAMPFNAGQPLLLVMEHGYKQYTGVTVSLRAPGMALDHMKRENGETTWRMMEMFAKHAALPKWKGAFQSLITHYNRIRHARLDVDCQGNNIMIDLQNTKMHFVDILSDEKSSLADAYCNIILGSNAVRLDEAVLGADPAAKMADPEVYRQHCRTILLWMLEATEKLELPFILKPEELRGSGESMFHALLTKYCGYEGAELEAMCGRITATSQHLYRFSQETNFDKTQRDISAVAIEPMLTYDSHVSRLTAYLDDKRRGVTERGA